MSKNGPNKTVAAARNAAFVCVEEKPFGRDESEAEKYRDECRAAGKNARVVSHKIGPKNAPSRQYRVCVYERA